jgi:glutaminyl-peptide cyclotransferase
MIIIFLRAAGLRRIFRRRGLYMQNYVVKIDPANGKVVGRLDLTSLVEQEKNRNPGCDVLNGIAYDPDADKVFVTGKLWSGFYEIVFSN